MRLPLLPLASILLLSTITLSPTWGDAATDAVLPPQAEILTPPASPSPQIHGPKVFGVRPNSPFLYRIPATGNLPLTYTADNLPATLHVDATTGQITGTLAQPGNFQVTLHAANSLGKTDRPFHIIVGDQIGLTPAMGWNTWYCYGTNIDQAKILAAAQAMADSGLARHGWTYINIDDTWQGKRGGDFNGIQPDPHRFPDIKSLVDSIHQLGLKAGIYSTPWVTSYAGHVGGSAENPEGTWEYPKTHGPYRKKILPYAIGQFSFATQDAKQWAQWGIDYLKYDWGPVELPESKEMADALRASGRDILFSISNNTSGNILAEAGDLSKVANSWRTTTDISDEWKSVAGNGFSGDKWAPFAGPGHFNDPDMLMVGAINKQPNHLTPDEQYSQVSLWCLMSAPLLLSCHLEQLDPFTLGLLTNDEVIDLDQDALGKQATKVAQDGKTTLYAKPLEDGTWAVGFFSHDPAPVKATLAWTVLGLSGSQTVRDLWRQKDLGSFDRQFSTDIPPHGVVLVRLIPAAAGK